MKLFLKAFAGPLFSFAAAAALLFYGAIVLQSNQRIPEFAAGCDAYGYLSMAEAFRQGRQAGSLPEALLPTFHLKDPQTRALTHLLQSFHLPPDQWDELVAPHAHHYFPKVDAVGPQYPPGTGWILSWFKRGQAVRDWNKVSIVCALGIALSLFAFLSFRKAWLTLGCSLMLSYWVLEVIQQVGDRSYSINCILIPLSMAYLFAFASKQSDSKRKAALEFLSGGLLGFSFFIRIPVLFLAPALDFFVHRPWFPTSLRLRPIFTPFRMGLLTFGILPLAAHQHAVTGSFFASTYSRGDNTPPSLEAAFKNWDFYLGKGFGSGDNWVILNLAVGALGVILLSSTRKGNRAFVAAGFTLVTSLAYFMTHSVRVGYYLIPTVLATSLLITFGIFKREEPIPLCDLKTCPKNVLALALAVLPGIFGFHHIWLMRGYWNAPPAFESRALPILPPEALAPGAWIWADDLSGSIRYYLGKAAFKIPFAEPSVRSQLFLEMKKLGAQQFLVEDSPTMSEIKNSLRLLGFTPIQVGLVSGKPLYRF